MSTNPNLNNEEVDLGSLFSQVGKAFSSFFSSIGRLFKSIFHAIIIFLLFLRKNIIPLGVATVLGVLLGVFMQKTKKEVYTSSMTIKANYSSAQKLYKELDYINALITEKDSVKIADMLGVKPTEASKLTLFSIEPIELNKQLLKSYDHYMQKTDTIYTRDFTFDDYRKRVDMKDVRFHQIDVESTIPDIFKKIETGLLNLASNNYYVQLHKSKIEELRFKKDELLHNIAQLDSIRKQYKEVALLQAKNGSKSTDVSFSNKSNTERNYDMDLYYMSLRLLKELDAVNVELIDNENLVNVESEFTYGTLKKSIASKLWFKYGAFGFLLVLFVLVALKVNTFLSNYEKKLA
jgi:hypothetical protein